MLLARLALNAGHPVGHDALISALWEADPPAQARTTLRGYVKRLRGALGRAGAGGGAALVRATDGGYRLALPRYRVDLFRFRDRVTEAAALSDPHRERALLGDALQLWRGPALSDVSSAVLRDEVTPALHEEWLHARQRHIELRLALGDDAELVPELTALVAENPLRETLWYQLILTLQRAGRSAEALMKYEALRELLADSLGVDPGPRLRALHQRILTGERISA